jgi:hypothetical protein
MATHPKDLGAVKVAKPCEREWDEMIGGNRSRFCTACKLNVYNLSELTLDEAQALIKQKEGELCVRFFQRADGTLITRDCPVGVSAHKRKVVAVSIASATVLGVTAAAAWVGDKMEAMDNVECTPHAETIDSTQLVQLAKTPASPKDTSWIEKRRSQFTGEPSMKPMGKFTSIQIIREKK